MFDANDILKDLDNVVSYDLIKLGYIGDDIVPDFPAEEPFPPEQQVRTTIPSEPDWHTEQAEENPEQAFYPEDDGGEQAAEEGGEEAPAEEGGEEAPGEGAPEESAEEEQGQAEAQADIGHLNEIWSDLATFDEDPIVWLEKVTQMADIGQLGGALSFLKRQVKTVKKAAGGVAKKLNPVKALKSASKKLTAIKKVSLGAAKKYARKSFDYAKGATRGLHKTAKNVAKVAYSNAKHAAQLSYKYAKTAAVLGKKYATKAAKAGIAAGKKAYKTTMKLRDEITDKIMQPFQIMKVVMIGGLVVGGIVLYTMVKD